MRTLNSVVSALALLCAATAQSTGAQDKPNIVVILTDDRGYADIIFNSDHRR